jgi:hypothetical protein
LAFTSTTAKKLPPKADVDYKVAHGRYRHVDVTAKDKSGHILKRHRLCLTIAYRRRGAHQPGSRIERKVCLGLDRFDDTGCQQAGDGAGCGVTARRLVAGVVHKEHARRKPAVDNKDAMANEIG